MCGNAGCQITLEGITVIREKLRSIYHSDLSSSQTFTSLSDFCISVLRYEFFSYQWLLYTLWSTSLTHVGRPAFSSHGVVWRNPVRLCRGHRYCFTGPKVLSAQFTVSLSPWLASWLCLHFALMTWSRSRLILGLVSLFRHWFSHVSTVF